MLDAKTFPDADVVKHAAQFVPVQIDTDQNRDLAKKFNIRALPTIAFIDADGEIAESTLGFKDAKKFVALLDSVTSRQLSKAKSAARKESADGEAQARLGLAHALQGQTEEAEAALQKARAASFRGPIVGRAYNSLGDKFVEGKQIEQAVDAFTLADRIGKDALVRAYAKHRLMVLYKDQGDEDNAKRAATALTNLEGAPEEYVTAAKEYLNG